MRLSLGACSCRASYMHACPAKLSLPCGSARGVLGRGKTVPAAWPAMAPRPADSQVSLGHVRVSSCVDALVACMLCALGRFYAAASSAISGVCSAQRLTSCACLCRWGHCRDHWTAGVWRRQRGVPLRYERVQHAQAADRQTPARMLDTWQGHAMLADSPLHEQLPAAAWAGPQAAVLCLHASEGSCVAQVQGPKVDYTSDSGVSEGGAMQPPPQPRRHRRAPPGHRGPLVGSTPMHTESRPSVLSNQRIGLVQHSGAP